METFLQENKNRLSWSSKQEFLEEQRGSGLSQSEYCRQKGLNVKLFYSWVEKARKLKSKGAVSKFVELKQPSILVPKVRSSSLELKLPNGAELKFTW